MYYDVLLVNLVQTKLRRRRSNQNYCWFNWCLRRVVRFMSHSLYTCGFNVLWQVYRTRFDHPTIWPSRYSQHVLNHRPCRPVTIRNEETEVAASKQIQVSGRCHDLFVFQSPSVIGNGTPLIQHSITLDTNSHWGQDTRIALVLMHPTLYD